MDSPPQSSDDPASDASVQPAVLRVNPTKLELRRRMLALLVQCGPAERAHASSLLCHQLLQLPELHSVGRIALYRALPEEADLSSLEPVLRARGCALYFPVVLNRERIEFRRVGADDTWTRGAFGILEPGPLAPVAQPGEIELFLVPGLAFDAHGRRLGRGKGYYDRALAQEPGVALRIGVAFALQCLPELPLDPWDLPMDYVVNERGVFVGQAGP